MTRLIQIILLGVILGSCGIPAWANDEVNQFIEKANAQISNLGASRRAQKAEEVGELQNQLDHLDKLGSDLDQTKSSLESANTAVIQAQRDLAAAREASVAKAALIEKRRASLTNEQEKLKEEADEHNKKKDEAQAADWLTRHIYNFQAWLINRKNAKLQTRLNELNEEEAANKKAVGDANVRLLLARTRQVNLKAEELDEENDIHKSERTIGENLDKLGV